MSKPPASSYQARYFPLPAVGTELAALEQECVRPVTGRRPVGLAFSGGGSRALSATMGQMRALRYLGLLEKSGYISAVSGGAWASTLYTFLPNSISDDEFLGGLVLDPGKLWWTLDDEKADPANLNYLPPKNMGRVPQRLGFVASKNELIRLWARYWVPKSKLWVRLIGERIFEPYGLSGINRYGDPDKFYSCSAEFVAKYITSNNPLLGADEFHLIERARPLLIVNASMFRDRDMGAQLVPVESTPVAAGIRAPFPDQGIPNDSIAGRPRRDFGGGLVQPFAMGSGDQMVRDAGLAQVESPRRFSLADMAGLSSAAFAETIDRTFLRWFGKLLPRYSYWPVENISAPKNTSTRYWFADGGNLENTGINALLARRLPVVVSFVNSLVAIEEVTDRNGDPVIKVDGSLPPLFGYAPLNKDGKYLRYGEPGIPARDLIYQHNQVFNPEDFSALREALWRAHKAGGPVIVVQSGLAVVPNPTFDVPGTRQTVKMVWVYNDKSSRWWEKLSPDLRRHIDWDPLQFRNFPHYKTVEQLELSPVQVNLLAQLTSWAVVQNEYPVFFTNQKTAGTLTSRQLFESLYR